MATPETRGNTAGAKPADDKPSVLPSAIAAEIGNIVTRLEILPETAQRRILEGARVSLGLMPLQPQGPKK